MPISLYFNLIVLLVVTSSCAGIKRYVPTVNASYRAIGEIILREADFGLGQTVIAFEENFDKNAHMTSFWSSLAGINTTILESTVEGEIQSFQYDLTRGLCTQVNPSDMETAGMTIGLRPIQKLKGAVIFPIRELLSLKLTDLAENGWSLKTVAFRGQIANQFNFRLELDSGVLEIEAYWAAFEGGSSMTTQKEIPLGFVISKITSPSEQPVVHVINIYYFAVNQVDDKMLQPIRGIYCPGRKGPDPLPNLKTYENLAWSAEFTWAENTITTGIDAWMDMQNQILRTDFEPLETLSGVVSPAESMIISFDEQTVFHINNEGKRECKVNHLDAETYYPQIIIDPRQQANWVPEAFFGTKNNQFFRIGQTTERGVPCDIYQAQRKDWPPGENIVITVWEWCFANDIKEQVQFSDGQLPLVSLTIYVSDSPYEEGVNKKPHKGQKMSFYFYNVRKVDPNRMETLAFDISPCFPGNRIITVSFLVDLKPSDREFLMKLDNDVQLNSEWRRAAYIVTKVSPRSLRITGVKSGFQDPQGPLMVQLTILDQHPNLAHRIEDMGIDIVILNLTDRINDGTFGIQYSNGNISISLNAIPGSVVQEETETSATSAYPLAFYRAQEKIAKYETDQIASKRLEMLPWLLGAVCLQIGVSIGIVSVVLKKRKIREDQARLVNQSPPSCNS